MKKEIRVTITRDLNNENISNVIDFLLFCKNNGYQLVDADDDDDQCYNLLLLSQTRLETDQEYEKRLEKNKKTRERRKRLKNG